MSNNHQRAARIFLKNMDRVHWHDQALWYVREKRDNATRELREFESLRNLADKIKQHTLSYLSDYLEKFETQAIKNGMKVHWALDATEHNNKVFSILKKKNISHVVKSKSMLTEECQLNAFLEKKGIEVIDTDLGERIIQLSREKPSHIVLPAIHKKKEEVGILFRKHLRAARDNNDPAYLTKLARLHLRDKFMNAEAAISGVNFAIAETGGFVICTNEGNADMGIHLAQVHIASMGIEKIIPRQADLGVFLRLLARSATGQTITTYSSHFIKPETGKEIHLIITDNGRSDIYRNPKYVKSLQCIRCGACLNTCPVYRRSGGHSYNYSIPGPIGSILAPFKDPGKYKSLPYASSLCGSCSDVCPVKIDIHEQLYKWRQDLQSNNHNMDKSLLAGIMQYVLVNPKRFGKLGLFARKMLTLLPPVVKYNRLNAWTKRRDLPDIPEYSFKEWYQNRTKKNEQ